MPSPECSHREIVLPNRALHRSCGEKKQHCQILCRPGGKIRSLFLEDLWTLPSVSLEDLGSSCIWGGQPRDRCISTEEGFSWSYRTPKLLTIDYTYPLMFLLDDPNVLQKFDDLLQRKVILYGPTITRNIMDQEFPVCLRVES